MLKAFYACQSAFLTSSNTEIGLSLLQSKGHGFAHISHGGVGKFAFEHTQSEIEYISLRSLYVVIAEQFN